MKRNIDVTIQVPITIEKIGKVDPGDEPLFVAFVDMNGSRRIAGKGKTELEAVDDLRSRVPAEIKKLWW